jgi:hypothetical protein
MLLKTSTLTAPWTIVEGDCKWYARVKALRTLVHALCTELEYVPPDPVSKSEKEMAKKGKKAGKGHKKGGGGKKKEKGDHKKKE